MRDKLIKQHDNVIVIVNNPYLPTAIKNAELLNSFDINNP